MEKIKQFFRKIWEGVKTFFKTLFDWLVRHPIALILTAGLIILTVLALIFGWKLQLGGLLDKIWNRQKPNLRAVVPEDRKDENGVPIQPGKSDDKGWTQAPVDVEIKEPGIFSNPDVIEIVHPEKGVVKIELPEGVKNKDIEEVIVLTPTTIEIKRNDKGVDTKKVLQILSR